jgi:hypothetical protein
MESRAFGSGEKRTFYHEIKLSKIDLWTLVACLLPLALGILIVWLGQGDYRYYPTLEQLNHGGLEYLLLGLLLLSLSIIIPLAFIKARVELD